MDLTKTEHGNGKLDWQRNEANHPDQHQRRANDIAASAIMARTEQRKLNAQEWLNRAKVNIDLGKLDLAITHIYQARLEYPEGYREPWEDNRDMLISLITET